MDILIIWAWSCDFVVANQSPTVGDTILFANDKSGIVRLLGARLDTGIGITYWEVVMDWSIFYDVHEPVNRVFKVNSAPKFWEKMEELTANHKALEVLR